MGGWVAGWWVCVCGGGGVGVQVGQGGGCAGPAAAAAGDTHLPPAHALLAVHAAHDAHAVLQAVQCVPPGHHLVLHFMHSLLSQQHCAGSAARPALSAAAEHQIGAGRVASSVRCRVHASPGMPAMISPSVCWPGATAPGAGISAQQHVAKRMGRWRWVAVQSVRAWAAGMTWRRAWAARAALPAEPGPASTLTHHGKGVQDPGIGLVGNLNVQAVKQLLALLIRLPLRQLQPPDLTPTQ